MKVILFLVLLFNIFSCSLYFRENKQLVKDYKYLSLEEFAKKHYTLYEEKHELTDSTILNKIYYSPQIMEEQNLFALQKITTHLKAFHLRLINQYLIPLITQKLSN